MTDGFKKGSGCFKCEECGKMTRETSEFPYVGINMCPDCIRRNEHNNYLSDNNIINCDCEICKKVVE